MPNGIDITEEEGKITMKCGVCLKPLTWDHEGCGWECVNPKCGLNKEPLQDEYMNTLFDAYPDMPKKGGKQFQTTMILFKKKKRRNDFRLEQ